MSGTTNPLIQQGTLNRLLTHVVCASLPQLNVSAEYMGKSQATYTFEETPVVQIGTATGIVNSPEPYVMGRITVSLLRTQGLAAAWLTQWQTQAIIGTVSGYPDSTVFPAITISNASITEFDPGVMDGNDPIVRLTLRGVAYPNSTLWLG